MARVRAAEGPGLIHAKVTRPYSHSAADTQSKYRSADELADEVAHDPLTLWEERLVAAGVLDAAGVEEIRRDAAAVVAEASKQALAAARPDPATVMEHVHVVPDIPLSGRSRPGQGGRDRRLRRSHPPHAARDHGRRRAGPGLR